MRTQFYARITSCIFVPGENIATVAFDVIGDDGTHVGSCAIDVPALKTVRETEIGFWEALAGVAGEVAACAKGAAENLRQHP